MKAWLRDRFELSRGGEGGNLRPMEGLRGFAVLLVFFVHFATLVQPWMQPGGLLARWLHGAHAVGNAGVDLFFVLSGYLIYGTLCEGRARFAPYLQRRIKRIYPAFLAVFAVYLVLTQLQPADARKLPADPTQAAIYVVQNLLLLPGLLPIAPLITVAWSLSYEFFYYLVIPAVVFGFGLRRQPPARRLALFMPITLLAFVAFAVFGGPVRLTLFLVGVMLHDLLRVRGDGRGPGTFAALAALMTCLGAMLVPMPEASGQALRAAILGAGFFVVCWHCFATPAAPGARLFCWTPLRWLGNMSYSYYLIHGLALQIFFFVLAAAGVTQRSDAFALACVLPAFAATLLVSAVLFLLVERPFSLATAATGRRRTIETRAAGDARP